MLVKMKTIMAGPHGSAHPGQTIEVQEQVGRELVERGYATEVAVPAQEPPLVKRTAVETATAPPAPETATVTGGAGNKDLDTTPGGISTVNSEAALELVAQAETPEKLAELRAAEKASQKHPGGRKGVLAAIAARRQQLVESAKGGR